MALRRVSRREGAANRVDALSDIPPTKGVVDEFLPSLLVEADGMFGESSMDRVSNVNRVATANALSTHLRGLVQSAGLVVQTHRAYESWRKGGRGLLQREVAAKVGVTKAVVSQLERGCNIPSDKVLRRIMHACGMNLRMGTAGHGFFQLLRTIRLYGDAVRRLAKETPR